MEGDERLRSRAERAPTYYFPSTTASRLIGSSRSSAGERTAERLLASISSPSDPRPLDREPDSPRNPVGSRVEGYRKNGNAESLPVRAATVAGRSSCARTHPGASWWQLLDDGMCITIRAPWLTIDRLRSARDIRLSTATMRALNSGRPRPRIVPRAFLVLLLALCLFRDGTRARNLPRADVDQPRDRILAATEERAKVDASREEDGVGGIAEVDDRDGNGEVDRARRIAEGNVNVGEARDKILAAAEEKVKVDGAEEEDGGGVGGTAGSEMGDRGGNSEVDRGRRTAEGNVDVEEPGGRILADAEEKVRVDGAGEEDGGRAEEITPRESDDNKEKNSEVDQGRRIVEGNVNVDQFRAANFEVAGENVKVDEAKEQEGVQAKSITPNDIDDDNENSEVNQGRNIVEGNVNADGLREEIVGAVKEEVKIDEIKEGKEVRAKDLAPKETSNESDNIEVRQEQRRSFKENTNVEQSHKEISGVAEEEIKIDEIKEHAEVLIKSLESGEIAENNNNSDVKKEQGQLSVKNVDVTQEQREIFNESEKETKVDEPRDLEQVQSKELEPEKIDDEYRNVKVDQERAQISEENANVAQVHEKILGIADDAVQVDDQTDREQAKAKDLGGEKDSDSNKNVDTRQAQGRTSDENVDVAPVGENLVEIIEKEKIIKEQERIQPKTTEQEEIHEDAKHER
ncbi:hypothetical protein KM043_011606 [Ampulex compressa]|nr:hypothetical protein KM043_011606 [Ampulex compressa]